MLNSLKLKNFKLFKSEEFTFGKINILSGVNKDDTSKSSNGSGKSSVLEALIFGLYGEGSGKNLSELVNFNSESCKTELQNETFRIVRTVPTKLSIYKNEAEIQFNTNTLKQIYVDGIFGTYDFFKKYRLLNRQSVNLLDLGLTSLRKELMSFIDSDFSEIRNSLLAKKLEREKLSKSNRPYSYYLSDKRKNLLEVGIRNYITEVNQVREEIEKQTSIVNNLVSQISIKTNVIRDRDKQIQEAQTTIANTNKIILDTQSIIDSINSSKTKEIICEDYPLQIRQKEGLITSLNEQTIDFQTQFDNSQKIVDSEQQICTKINTELVALNDIIAELEMAIQEAVELKVNVKCDKCGSEVSSEKKEVFIREKKDVLNIYLNNRKQKEEDLVIHTANLKSAMDKLDVAKKESNRCKIDMITTQKDIKSLNQKQIDTMKAQREQAKIDNNRVAELNRLLDQIKMYDITIHNSNVKILALNEDIKILKQEIVDIEEVLEVEKDFLNNYKTKLIIIEKKEKSINLCYNRLQEAYKFAHYQYSKEDIELYNAAVKVLDEFSSWHIQRWLDSLTVIINELLEKVNLKVIFSADKQFLTIVNQEQEMGYQSLSSGQQLFLNLIFKIGIMLNNGITNGLLVIDEGVGTLDLVNLHKLIDILKTTQFQVFLVYQNIDEVEDVNRIEIIRQNNESRKNET